MMKADNFTFHLLPKLRKPWFIYQCVFNMWKSNNMKQFSETINFQKHTDEANWLNCCLSLSIYSHFLELHSILALLTQRVIWDIVITLHSSSSTSSSVTCSLFCHSKNCLVRSIILGGNVHWMVFQMRKWSILQINVRWDIPEKWCFTSYRF